MPRLVLKNLKHGGANVMAWTLIEIWVVIKMTIQLQTKTKKNTKPIKTIAAICRENVAICRE